MALIINIITKKWDTKWEAESLAACRTTDLLWCVTSRLVWWSTKESQLHLKRRRRLGLLSKNWFVRPRKMMRRHRYLWTRLCSPKMRLNLSDRRLHPDSNPYLLVLLGLSTSETVPMTDRRLLWLSWSIILKLNSNRMRRQLRKTPMV